MNPGSQPHSPAPSAESRAYFAGTRAEYLDRVRGLFRDYKEWTLRFTDPQPGHHLLDMGCGTGDDARALAALVAPGGRVTGVDADPAMVREATARAQTPLLQAEFLQADGASLPFPADTFDRVRADRVLQYFAEPARPIAELFRVARPGGLVAVFDTDWGTLVLDSAHREVTRRILNAACDRETQGWMGRQLYGLCREAGLADVEAGFRGITVTDLAAAGFLLGLETHAARAREQGLVSEGEHAAWLQDLRERDRQGIFFAAVAGFGVRGRKVSP